MPRRLPGRHAGVSVTLPQGATINPAAGNGLEACTDAQLAAGTHHPVGCPAGSRVGSVSIATPLLPDRLAGGVYIGAPQPGNRYRLFLVAEGRGVTVRLKGHVAPTRRPAVSPRCSTTTRRCRTARST